MSTELLEITRPILFESAHEEWPYWGKGSSFLASVGEHVFFVSAKHVFQNQAGSPDSLRIFPSDASRISIPFIALVLIRLDGVADESFKDLYLLKVDVDLFKESGDAPLHTIALENACVHPEKIAEGDSMLLFGFPSELRGIDYESCKISYNRKLLWAAFQGPSLMDHCFKLIFNDCSGLTDFDGYSGCPVFHFIAGEVPRLAGIMITGSVSSRSGHFIGVHVLISAIRKAIAQ